MSWHWYLWLPMKTATRPGRVGGLGDEPGRGPPELPVVGADVAGAVRSGLIGDVGDDRLPLALSAWIVWLTRG